MSFSRFFRDYLMAPVLMPALTACYAVYDVSQEVEPYTYTSYAWAWPRADEHTREVIREAMADGKISRWESPVLFRTIMDDVHGLMSCPAGEECRKKTVEQTRDMLREAMTK